jgi:hypothetical protein
MLAHLGALPVGAALSLGFLLALILRDAAKGTGNHPAARRGEVKWTRLHGQRWYVTRLADRDVFLQLGRTTVKAVNVPDENGVQLACLDVV